MSVDYATVTGRQQKVWSLGDYGRVGSLLSWLGESLVRGFLHVWDNPEGRERIAALLRSAATHDDPMTLLRQFLLHEVFGRVAGRVGPQDLERRAALVATQMIGLAFARYVAGLPGVADAEPDELVAAVGPVIQRYLDL